MQATRIAVLRGGPSDEYDVSMQTGESVLSALKKLEHDPIDITITKSGIWLVEGFERYPEHILPTIDLAFLALHGSFGEDGTIQRMLERNSVPFTGSRSYPSSIAMHKILTKDQVREQGVRMAPHILITSDSLGDIHLVSDNIAHMFGPQYVIKPTASGSSIGTQIAKNPAELPKRLTTALGEYDEVIVEKRIKGREATCGIIENFRGEEQYVLPIIEIIPPEHADFFDRTVKYDDTTKEICPGRFTREEKETMEKYARIVHDTLGLSQYSRSDFMLDENGVHFLEVNTLPGLTPQSLFPKAIDAVGGTYEGFIDHLVHDALEHS